MQATTYMGQPAFLFEDQEDAQGLQTHSTLVVMGTGVFRAQKTVSVNGQTAMEVIYDPAFLRFDEAWTTDGQSVTLDDGWTQKCLIPNVVKGCNAAGAVTPGTTTHSFTVVKASVSVTVAAGTFDAVQIQRVDPNTNETKLYWFAAGVGKVLEQAPAAQAVEELVSYSIP